MSDHRNSDQPVPGEPQPPSRGGLSTTDPIELIDECLAAFPDGDPRQKLLYKLRHVVTAQSVAQDRRDTELKKLHDVVAKLTAPANRVGLLVEVPAEGVARIVVGGAEYYANIDPRLSGEDLKIGTQILVNEAYTVIKTLGYDRSGPVLKVAEVLPDGRIRFEQDMGRQALILQRSSDLLGTDLKAGDEVRIEPTHRIAIEKFENRQARTHLLDEVPSVTWEQIGGQHQAIEAIRKAIEYPLLHADTFTKYQFTQPKGFLLYGPPGCGKTLIGQAAAASLSQFVRESQGQAASDGKTKNPPVTSGAFLHIKGPEILNMWLGESERIVRDLFAKARARRKEGALPFIFIDEAESRVGHQAVDAVVQHQQYVGADVLRRNGRHRIAAGCGDHSGFQSAGLDRSGGAETGSNRSEDQGRASESGGGLGDSWRSILRLHCRLIVSCWIRTDRTMKRPGML